MTWWQYVQDVAATGRQRDITDRTEVDATEVSRWKGGKVPSPTAAAGFARGYGRPVLEAFVAAGFLSAEEAKERPTARPDLSALTNDQLLELVRSRMREETGRGSAPQRLRGVSQEEVEKTRRLGGQHGTRKRAAKKGSSAGQGLRKQQDDEAAEGGA